MKKPPWIMVPKKTYEKLAADYQATTELLAAVDAIFDLAIKYQWRILSDEAAARFKALQDKANAIRGE